MRPQESWCHKHKQAKRLIRTEWLSMLDKSSSTILTYLSARYECQACRCEWTAAARARARKKVPA
jgi:hypothetical protein